MSIRMNDLVNFKGDKYITQPDLDAAIGGSGEKGPLIDESTGNLRAEYNPITVLSMEHQEPDVNEGNKADQDFSKLKFIGNCKVIYGDNGQITIRVGENVNSSNWGKGTEDGTTNGTVSATYQNNIVASSDYAFPSDVGVSEFTKATIKGKTNNDISVTSAEVTHFDVGEGIDNHFEVKVTRGGEQVIYYSDKITVDGSVSSIKFHETSTEGTVYTPITMKIDNYAVEKLSAKGATGKQGKATITIKSDELMTGIADDYKVYTFSISHMNGGEGEMPWTGAESIVYINDNTTVPAVGKVTVDGLSLGGTRRESGVDHVISATVNVSVTGINNIYKPAAAGTKVSIKGTGIGNKNYTAAGGAFNMTDTSKTGVGSITNEALSVSSGDVKTVSAAVTAMNINGSSVEVKSNDYSINVLIEPSSDEGKIEESNRLNEKLEKWNNALSLADGGAGAEGLQVNDKKIQYPQTDYSSFNASGENVPTLRPDYSGCTGMRSYLFKIVRSGTMNGGIIEITHSNGSIEKLVKDGHVIIEISKGAKSGDGLVWYNIGRGSTAGDSTNITTGKCSYGSTLYHSEFAFIDGGSKDFIYFRVKMDNNAKSTQISNIVLK